MMKLMTVLDNEHGVRKSLIAEHGLSFYIETGETKILFDFGSSSSALENAKKLNIPLPLIDWAVISHAHYDHGGGYPGFVEAGLHCPLWTGRDFFREKYAQDGLKAGYLGCGFDERWLLEHTIEHRICEGFSLIAPNCYLLGDFERQYTFETIPKQFVYWEQGRWVGDTFEDEIALIIDSDEGQIVVVGCSHPGILNILAKVYGYFQKPIRAVFGGTHLIGAGSERIEQTIAVMKKMGLRLLGFNHCSGSAFRERVERDQELSSCYLGSGDCIYL